ncbi:MAG: hypothetical protein JF599_08610 [Verrucomicrobia bacterium]|nr:hypothetical protein [Verrucomicrobiota bacterium]
MFARLHFLAASIASIFALLLTVVSSARADENLFGYVSGAETLPKGHYDLYQTTTARAGKDAGYYRGWDFETEVEYGFTDKFQGSATLLQHYFDVKNVPGLDDQNQYQFGGVEFSAKYRFKSVFKDGYGLALRPEVGFMRYDDVAGIMQRMLYVAPTLIYQKNFLDDTLIFAANGGFQLAWGKKPAEEYEHELSLKAGTGLSYRFAPNWFAGVETHIVSEYPMFNQFEHTVLFAGPSLHYGAQRWWATLSWAWQAWGREVDPTVPRMAFAEEARNEFRLKIGLNF